jgi:hypothetical protein
MKQNLAGIILLAALAALAHSALAQAAVPSRPAKQAGKSPVKVFILAGQSNMQGQGVTGINDEFRGQKGTLVAMLADLADAGAKHLQRQTPAGLAIGAGIGRAPRRRTGRRLSAQDQGHGLAAATVRVQNLQEKAPERTKRRPEAIAPGVAAVAAGPLDLRVGPVIRECRRPRLHLPLENPPDLCDTAHPWPPLRFDGLWQTHQTLRRPSLSSPYATTSYGLSSCHSVASPYFPETFVFHGDMADGHGVPAGSGGSGQAASTGLCSLSNHCYAADY